MKRLIITALLVVATGLVFGQSTPKTSPTKPDTTKKVFTPDYDKTITISVSLPAYTFGNYFYTLQTPGYENGELKGKEIAAIKQNAARVVDSLYSAYSKILKAQYDKFVADTTKHTKIKQK